MTGELSEIEVSDYLILHQCPKSIVFYFRQDLGHVSCFQQCLENGYELLLPV